MWDSQVDDRLKDKESLRVDVDSTSLLLLEASLLPPPSFVSQLHLHHYLSCLLPLLPQKMKILLVLDLQRQARSEVSESTCFVRGRLPRRSSSRFFEVRTEEKDLLPTCLVESENSDERGQEGREKVSELASDFSDRLSTYHATRKVLTGPFLLLPYPSVNS